MIPKKFVLLSLTAAALAAAVQTGSAAVSITTSLDQTSRAAFTVSTTDLINGLTPTSNTYTGQFEGNSANALPAMTDGSAGSGTATTAGQVAFDRDHTWNVVYTLPTIGAPLGYDLTSIATYAGHNDARVDQFYTFEVQYVGSSTWTTIASVDYDALPSNAAGNASTRVVIGDTAQSGATGVSAVRFTFAAPPSNTGNPAGGSVYREFDVFGTPSTVPETSSALLSVVGLAGLLGFRRRSA